MSAPRRLGKPGSQVTPGDFHMSADPCRSTHCTCTCPDWDVYCSSIWKVRLFAFGAWCFSHMCDWLMDIFSNFSLNENSFFLPSLSSSSPEKKKKKDVIVALDFQVLEACKYFNLRPCSALPVQPSVPSYRERNPKSQRRLNAVIWKIQLFSLPSTVKLQYNHC